MENTVTTKDTRMSFINVHQSDMLDALRKSEIARQAQVIPQRLQPLYPTLFPSCGKLVGF